MQPSAVPNDNWSFQHQPGHLLLEHRIRQGSRRATLLACGLGCLLLFGYGALAIFSDALRGLSSVEIGGWVFLLLMLAGVAFGILTLLRLFAVTRYELHPDLLRVEELRFGKLVRQEIPRLLISEISCAFTPSKSTRGDDTFKIVLHWKDPGGQSRWLAMEGDSKLEADWLGPILSAWSGQAIHHEPTGA